MINLHLCDMLHSYALPVNYFPSVNISFNMVASYHYRFLAKGFKRLLHLRIVNVGIDHGGGEIGVPEHHLTLRGLRAIMERRLPCDIRWG